ncbi:MAG: glycerate kinase [Actinomycetota bacterium]
MAKDRSLQEAKAPRVVVAPDSFKGSLTAAEVAGAIAEGLSLVWPDAQMTLLPLSDGGEGWVETIVTAAGGRRVTESVTGPLGAPVEATYGLIELPEGPGAVIEMASASGLHLIDRSTADPRRTTTYGTGELIVRALDRGVRRLLVGIGDSATNDGGAGLAEALGVRLLDAGGARLGPGGTELARLERVDLSSIDRRVREMEVLVASDVDNPLTGEHGASAVFGPQKGASPEVVAELDAALAHFADKVEAEVGRTARDEPGAGAAGGLGFGLMMFCDVLVRPGIELSLDAVGADAAFEAADLVITGEGRIDAQTLRGKAPVGVARRAQRFGVPVVAIAGSIGPLDDDLAGDLRAAGISVVCPIIEEPSEPHDVMDPEATVHRLRRTARRIAGLIDIGRILRGEERG